MTCSTLLKFTLFARNMKPHVVKSTDLHYILNTNINKCHGEKTTKRILPSAMTNGGSRWGTGGPARPPPPASYLRVWMTTQPPYLKVSIRHWPHRRISRRWNQRGIDEPCDSFRSRLCAPSNLFWSEMKIDKMILKSNTRKENLEFSRSATY